MIDDYDLYRMWWFAAMYGASPEIRMNMLDEKRLRCAYVTPA
jgi:hypothetical protein